MWNSVSIVNYTGEPESRLSQQPSGGHDTSACLTTNTC